jgi:hypothetical protein
LRTFSVVKGSGTLPATEQMPSTSISGLASARRIATASSCPGSVSMTILAAVTFALLRLPRWRRPRLLRRPVKGKPAQSG